jgi:outer membrane receptor protein involved in Fe transport
MRNCSGAALRQQRASDSGGNFVAPLLPVGKYRLTIELPGFKKVVQENIVLNVKDNFTAKFVLQVGNVSETVSVQETVTQVQLRSSEQSTAINGTQIRELALVTRNYAQLVALMPGVTSASVDQLYVGNSLPSGQSNTIPFSINGTRNSGSGWTIDGADNVDRGSNQTLINTPSIDSIAEFKVQRGRTLPLPTSRRSFERLESRQPEIRWGSPLLQLIPLAPLPATAIRASCSSLASFTSDDLRSGCAAA